MPSRTWTRRRSFAAWWDGARSDLKALTAQGCQGLLDGWVTTVLTGLEAGGQVTDWLDHKLVVRLLPELLEKSGELESQVAELDAAIKEILRLLKDSPPEFVPPPP